MAPFAGVSSMCGLALAMLSSQFWSSSVPAMPDHDVLEEHQHHLNLYEAPDAIEEAEAEAVYCQKPFKDVRKQFAANWPFALSARFVMDVVISLAVSYGFCRRKPRGEQLKILQPRCSAGDDWLCRESMEKKDAEVRKLQNEVQRLRMLLSEDGSQGGAADHISHRSTDAIRPAHFNIGDEEDIWDEVQSDDAYVLPNISFGSCAGASWDWPLSRDEARSRIHMIDQIMNDLDQTKLAEKLGKFSIMWEVGQDKASESCASGRCSL